MKKVLLTLASFCWMSCVSSSNENDTIPLDPSLIAHWDFNDSGSILSDISSHRNHGIINGATWVSGIDGRALSFDGVSNYAKAENIGKNQSTLTISFWFKCPSQNLNYPKFFTIDDENIEGGMDGNHPSYVSAGKVGWIWIRVKGEDGSNNDATSNTPFDDNQWHNYCSIFDGVAKRKRIYVDGILRAESSIVDKINLPSGNLYLGWSGPVDYAPNQTFTKGIFDEVRIYNRAVSVTEIESEWNKYRARI